MMDFWKTTDGELEDSGDFEIGGGEPLPEMTANAMITEAGWHSFENEPEHISLTWTVLEPAEYKNRKVFQKIHVNSDDDKKRNKAIRMINAIDKNAGGVLPRDEYPEDEHLAALKRAMMPISIKVWEIEGKKVNWVAAVSSGKKASSAAPASTSVSHTSTQAATQRRGRPASASKINEDDVPF